MRRFARLAPLARLARLVRLVPLAVAVVVGCGVASVGCSGEDGSSIRDSVDPTGGQSSPTDAGTSAPADPATTPAPDGGAATPDPDDAGRPEIGAEESGEATYYDANGTGACGFEPSNDFMVAAMNDEQYDKATCGKCVEVTGPKGKAIVRIVDKCPGCDRGDLDLSRTAFSKLANLSAGRIKIKWHMVACP